MSTKIHGAPPLTVTTFSWWHVGHNDSRLLHGVSIESGSYFRIFRNNGDFAGRRYYDRTTHESRFADFHLGGSHTDWRPEFGTEINDKTLDRETNVMQGPDALEFVKEMARDCPAIVPILAPVLKRYGAWRW